MLLLQVEIGRLLVKLLGGSLLNDDSILGTFPEAGTEAITIYLADEFCLAINNLKGTLDTGGYADATTVTLLLVDSYDFPYSFGSSHYLPP